MKIKSFVGLLFGVSVIVCGILWGCGTSKVANEKYVPYKVAQHYFVRNDVEQLPPSVIRTSDEFNNYFGMAAVMGKDGLPTSIDFDKEYVICVTLAPTNTPTEILPVSLTENPAGGDIVLRYEIKSGHEQPYTMQPLLLLVVDRKYDLPVKLEAL